MRQLELEFEESSSSRRGERTRAGVCLPLCARRSTARRASIVSLRTSGAAQQAHHCLTGHGPFPTHNTYPQGGHCQLAGARRARGTEGGQSPHQSSRLPDVSKAGQCLAPRALAMAERGGVASGPSEQQQQQRRRPHRPGPRVAAAPAAPAAAAAAAAAEAAEAAAAKYLGRSEGAWAPLPSRGNHAPSSRGVAHVR